MANSTTSNIKNLGEQSSSHLQGREQIGNLSGDRKSKNTNSSHLIDRTMRLEKSCKYWSILANVAAIVSVTSAVYSIMNKRRFW